MVPMLQILVLRRMPGGLVWISAALASAGMMLMAQHAGGAGVTIGRGEAFALGGACAIAAEITLVAIFAPMADPRRLAVLQCAFVGRERADPVANVRARRAARRDAGWCAGSGWDWSARFCKQAAIGRCAPFRRLGRH